MNEEFDGYRGDRAGARQYPIPPGYHDRRAAAEARTGIDGRSGRGILQRGWWRGTRTQFRSQRARQPYPGRIDRRRHRLARLANSRRAVLAGDSVERSALDAGQPLRRPAGARHVRALPVRPSARPRTATHQPMPYEAAAQDDLATKAHHAGAALQREAGEAEDAFQDRVDAARATVLGLTRDAGEAAESFRRRVEDGDELRGGARQDRSSSDVGESASQLAERGQAAARDLYDYGASATRARATGRAAPWARCATWAAGRSITSRISRCCWVRWASPWVRRSGLLVPSSRYERRLAGSLRDSLGETARQMAGDAGQSVARVASPVLDTAQESSPP